jgi:hypothetical protein
VGAVPEIHEKLRMVGPHEEIFVVHGLSGGGDAPDPQDVRPVDGAPPQ